MSFTQGLSGSLNVTGTITSGSSNTVTTDDSSALLIEDSSGTDILRVDTNNGRVHINETATDTYPLTIAHNAGAPQIALEDSGNLADGRLGMDGSGNLLVSNNGPINLSADSGSTAHLSVNSSTVDIGTLKLSNGSVDTSSGSLSLSAAGGTAITIDSSAAVTVDEIISSVGSNADPSFTFSGDDTTGLYRAAAGSIGVTSTGTLKATFDSDGLTMNASRITGLADPVDSDEAVNKNYVDAFLFGLSPKESVRVATTAAGTLATGFEDGDTIDGVALSTNDRILIKDQSSGTENGIYVVQASGAPVRAADLAEVSVSITTVTGTGGNTVQIVTGSINNLNVGDYVEINGNTNGGAESINGLKRVTDIIDTFTFEYDNLVAVGTPNNDGTVYTGARAAGTHVIVQEGAVNADIAYICSTNASDGDIVGRFALTWVQFTTLGSLIGGDGIDISASVVSVDEKGNGGLVIESGQLAVDLGATSITGTLAVSDGGTGTTSLVNNQVLTGGSSIISEANLTFDGSLLDITGDMAFSGVSQASDGTVALPSYSFLSNLDSGISLIPSTIAEITVITFPDETTFATSGPADYLFMDTRTLKFYFWFFPTGSSATDPGPFTGRTGVQVPHISTSAGGINVAVNFSGRVNTFTSSTMSAVTAGTTSTVTNAVAGAVDDADVSNMPGGTTSVVTQQGKNDDLVVSIGGVESVRIGTDALTISGRSNVSPWKFITSGNATLGSTDASLNFSSLTAYDTYKVYLQADHTSSTNGSILRLLLNGKTSATEYTTFYQPQNGTSNSDARSTRGIGIWHNVSTISSNSWEIIIPGVSSGGGIYQVQIPYTRAIGTGTGDNYFGGFYFNTGNDTQIHTITFEAFTSVGGNTLITFDNMTLHAEVYGANLHTDAI